MGCGIAGTVRLQEGSGLYYNIIFDSINQNHIGHINHVMESWPICSQYEHDPVLNTDPFEYLVNIALDDPLDSIIKLHKFIKHSTAIQHI